MYIALILLALFPRVPHIPSHRTSVPFHQHKISMNSPRSSTPHLPRHHKKKYT